MLAGQDRVFALVLEVAAVARLAREVHAAAQGHVEALVAQLGADQRAVVVRQFGSQLDAAADRTKAAPWSSGSAAHRW